VVKSGQRPSEALTQDGIEYIEVRALDLNPYLPFGIDSEQIHFLDSFLLHCLLGESPECHKQEFFEVAGNLAKVVEHGRDPELFLNLESKPKKMRDWGNDILTEVDNAASLLDHIHGSTNYSNSVTAQSAKIADPELTPSGRILKDMKEGDISFFEFSMQQSRKHRDDLQSNGMSEATVKMMTETAAQSLKDQTNIESLDTVDFDEYLKNWNDA
jgi:glutamate--cysteine ligase